jgi:hypothetical protein
MPRIKIGPESSTERFENGLAERLAYELKSDRQCGQPLIYEKTFETGKVRVVVIWDDWQGIPLQERSATILRAYELAEGRGTRERIALVSGLTVPEAHAAGMLPYQIITALRRGDPVTSEQAREAFLEEGASQLANPNALQLWFATKDEAEACRQRLLRRFPGTEDVWIINREHTAQDFSGLGGWALGDEG